MPELPDLTIFARNLSKLILNKEIASAAVHNSFKVNAASATLLEKLAGSHFVSIERDGKELLFRLANGNALSAHLMLGGRFAVGTAREIAALPSKVIDVGFIDGSAFAVADQMRMAKVKLGPKPAKAPDVLGDAFTFEYFLKTAQRNEIMNVKEFLITQKYMRGIGNAYADEILYAANISPENFLGRIPEARLRELYDAIPAVLLNAIEQIAAIAPDIIAGEERGFLKVHRKDLAQTAKGEPILKKNVAGKSTYFVEGQELFLP